ncbi:hypothetical protein GALL_376020 [mine drainage metagenome]|uniref:Uncharacterized protein n=1 Tax=mine drainage metagenome TaxID=410659 RepID=A0A1J5QKZ7_9ZZZZ
MRWACPEPFQHPRQTPKHAQAARIVRAAVLAKACGTNPHVAPVKRPDGQNLAKKSDLIRTSQNTCLVRQHVGINLSEGGEAFKGRRLPEPHIGIRKANIKTIIRRRRSRLEAARRETKEVALSSGIRSILTPAPPARSLPGTRPVILSPDHSWPDIPGGHLTRQAPWAFRAKTSDRRSCCHSLGGCKSKLSLSRARNCPGGRASPQTNAGNIFDRKRQPKASNNAVQTPLHHGN